MGMPPHLRVPHSSRSDEWVIVRGSERPSFAPSPTPRNCHPERSEGPASISSPELTTALSTPQKSKNPRNPHKPSEIKFQNSWHTSFTQPAIIKSGCKTKLPGATSRAFAVKGTPGDPPRASGALTFIRREHGGLGVPGGYFGGTLGGTFCVPTHLEGVL
jgi:hypothetical protein